ncbi:hypothetical protein [Blastopirellula marina]|uniref:Uncharacterized protein n=1 Tax=Blastopirellula marina TaxID=124 RepID=A0A2S8F375_9BACT|nr:hypothetical protein [Blastopirellula marina]PQO26622.1 hypothetical protein C5Y98_30035 [Blastopirellula marina]PTL40933.1 hypothetical protein C5Y97_30050 [Blastopirellula marina]
MTAQTNDRIRYLDKDYVLAGINGAGLFEPQQIGLEVVSTSTACWRGFVCEYALNDEALILARLTVGLTAADLELAEQGLGPVHFDIVPTGNEFSYQDPKTGETKSFWLDWSYDDLSHPIHYAGGLLIAADFIQDLYVHMGFHPAYKYREVHELIFDQGQLQSATDRSAQMAEFREMLADVPLSPQDPDNRQEIHDWVEQAFRRNYKL